jgi:probable HAF family extracellular repeat protein
MLISIALIALGCAAPQLAVAQTYTIVDLGRLGAPDDDFGDSYAFALNNRGQVVGLTGTLTGSQTGFLWTASGGMVDLGFQFQGPGQIINDYGQIVSGFLWQPIQPNASTGTRITLPSGASGLGINSYGQIFADIVQPISVPPGFSHRAVLLTPTVPNGTEFTVTDLGLPGDISGAAAINSRGQVVGNYFVGDYPNGYDKAFLWTPDSANGTTGSWTDLGGLDGYNSSTAGSINDAGQIAGSSSHPVAPTAPQVRAFRWTPSQPNGTAGITTDLGSFGGTTGISSAGSINNAGQIQGYSTTPDGFNVGCLWLDGVPTNPASLIPGGTPNGLISNMGALNNNGQIVGRTLFSGYYDAGTWIPAQYNAFLMTPVTTTTAPGTTVSVTPDTATTLTFDTVVTAGDTTVTTVTSPPSLPPNFQVGGDTFDIATTATFSGPVQVCVSYDPAQFSDPTQVRLLHYVNGGWTDITTSVNSVSHLVCGTTTSFSPFVLAKPKLVSWSGVLQPVNTNGSSVFKLGSTIPVKFNLTAADAGKTNLVAKLYVSQKDSVDPTEINEATSTSAADSGNVFRTSGGQYIFNLSTKSLSKGTWYLRVDLGDGSSNVVQFKLK